MQDNELKYYEKISNWDFSQIKCKTEKLTDWDFYEFKRIEYTYMDENELVKVTYDVRLKQYFEA